jgi:hypothetical protein
MDNNNPIDQLQQPVVPEQTVGPATTENQQETQQVQDQITAEQAAIEAENAAKMNQARASLQSASPLALAKEPTDQETFVEMEKLEAEKAAAAKMLEDEEKLKQQQLQNKLNERKAILQRAASQGINLERDEELDPLIEQQEQEEEAKALALAAQQQANEARMQEAQTPTEQEIEAVAAPIRQQNANMAAERQEMAKEQINQAKIKEYTNGRLESIDKKIKEINQMRVDPNRYWNNQSTGQKILAAIGMALGAYSQSLTGSRNVAMDVINQQIEIDIQEQRDQRKLAVDEVNALRADYWRSVNNKLDTMRFQSLDNARKAQIANMKNQIQMRSQEFSQQAQQLAQQRALAIRAEAGGDLPPEVVAGLSKEDRKRYVPGYGLAKDAEVAKKTTAALESAEAIMDNVKQIENLFAKHGTREVLDRGAVAAEESARRGMQLQLKELFNLGVLNGPDLDLLNEFTGKDFFFALTTTDANKKAKLQGVRNYVESKIKASLKRAGLAPAVEKKTKLDRYVEALKAQGLDDIQARRSAAKLLNKGY